MNAEQLQEYRELAERLSYFGLEGRAQDAITALLAMVERLTARAEEAEALLAGSPADTLAWALDKREQELREARREVDRLTGELAAANAALAQAQDIAQTALDSFAAANTALAAERDAAKRHAAYIASCVDECGSYRP